MLQLSLSDLQALLEKRLDDVYSPRADAEPDVPFWHRTKLLSLTEDHLVAHRRPAYNSVREGGTWSGPAQFEIFDMMGFLLTVANLPPGHDALTTHCSVNFLQAPPAEDLIAEARMLRMSRKTAVVDVVLRCESIDGILAQATVSYLTVSGIGIAAHLAGQQAQQIEEGAPCT